YTRKSLFSSGRHGLLFIELQNFLGHPEVHRGEISEILGHRNAPGPGLYPESLIDLGRHAHWHAHPLPQGWPARAGSLRRHGVKNSTDGVINPRDTLRGNHIGVV